MPDIRAYVTVSQSSEGRVVEATLRRDLLEQLLSSDRVEFGLGDDDAEFEDQTAAATDDPDNPSEVVRLALVVVDDFGIGD